MNHRLTLTCAALASLWSASCSDSSTAFSGALRVVNAIPDAQPIDASVSNVTTDINNIAFGAASGFRVIPEGSYKVQMTTTPSGGGNAVTITADNVSVDHNNQTTVYAVGTLAQSSGMGLAVERNSDVSIPSGKTEVQFVDAVAAALTDGAGKVYVVPPGQGTTKAIYSVSLQSPVGVAQPATSPYSDPTQIDSGTYEIIIQDSGGTTVFDSGSTGITFGDGASLQFAALDATASQLGTSGSALQVLETDNGSGNTTTLLNNGN